MESGPDSVRAGSGRGVIPVAGVSGRGHKDVTISHKSCGIRESFSCEQAPNNPPEPALARGLDVFRRLLSSSEVPPYVLAMGMAVDGVGASDIRPRIVAGAGRKRDAVATPYRAPGTPLERTLTTLWEKVLGFSPIGIDDQFFDLGGDSIEAIQILNLLQRPNRLFVSNAKTLLTLTKQDALSFANAAFL